MCGHPNCVLGFLSCLNFLLLIVIGIVGLAAYPYVDLFPNVFQRGLANVSDMYPVDVSPIDGTFAVWGVIFLWQLIWSIYSLTGLFRKIGEEKLYLNPILLPAAFHVSFMISLLFTIGWMFLWDRLFISLALIAILVTSAFLYVALGLSYVALDRNVPLLHVQERKSDIWATRILVQNGIALYATWSTVEAFLILAAVLSYTSQPAVSIETSSTVALGLFAGAILIYALTDFFVFDRFSRFVLTPYIAFIVVLSGMFANTATLETTNAVFIVSLLATSAVVLLTKLFFICLRQITKPSESAETTEFLRELDESRHLLK